VSCDLTQCVLHGYVDGELDAARAADFERHLLSCPECVAALEAQEALRASIQRAGLYERAPTTLRQKVDTELGGSRRRTPVTIDSASHASSWRWLALAAGFVLAATLVWKLIPGPHGDSSEATYASAIVDAHLRSLQPGHLEDVISTDQHTVKPWFDGKIDFAPPVRDFASDGFPLLGGRLDVVHGRTVAVLVYGRRKHVINVFIWPAAQGDSPPQSGSQLGYNWVDWRKSGMELCAVSDANAADLDALRRLLTE
jgi:anti-sigma factor (TIGR02949 family)